MNTIYYLNSAKGNFHHRIFLVYVGKLSEKTTENILSLLKNGKQTPCVIIAENQKLYAMVEQGYLPLNPPQILSRDYAAFCDNMGRMLTDKQRAILKQAPSVRRLQELAKKITNDNPSPSTANYRLEKAGPVKPVSPKPSEPKPVKAGPAKQKTEFYDQELARCWFGDPMNSKYSVLFIRLNLSRDERLALSVEMNNRYGHEPQEEAELPLIQRNLLSDWVPLNPYCFRLSGDEQELAMYDILTAENYQQFYSALHAVPFKDLSKPWTDAPGEQICDMKISTAKVAKLSAPVPFLATRKTGSCPVVLAEDTAKYGYGIFVDSRTLNGGIKLTPHLLTDIYNQTVWHMRAVKNPDTCQMVTDMILRGFLPAGVIMGNLPMVGYLEGLQHIYRDRLPAPAVAYMEKIWENMEAIYTTALNENLFSEYSGAAVSIDNTWKVTCYQAMDRETLRLPLLFSDMLPSESTGEEPAEAAQKAEDNGKDLTDADIEIGAKVRVRTDNLREIEPDSILAWFVNSDRTDDIFTVTQYIPTSCPHAPFILDGMLCETSFAAEELELAKDEA